MRKTYCFVFIFLLSILASSCVIISGSGNIITEDKTPQNTFSGIDIDGTCEVRIKEDVDCSVRITADDNIFDYLTVSETNGILNISLSTNNYDKLENFTLYIVITMPTLKSLNVSGVNSIEISTMSLTENLSLEIDGTNTFNTNNSTVTGDLNVKMDGVNEFNFYGLKVTGDAALDIDGVEDLFIDVSGTISGSLRGVSNLTYKSGTLSSDFKYDKVTCIVTKLD